MTKFWKTQGAMALLFWLGCCAAVGADMSSSDFLSLLRDSAGRNGSSYAKLTGTAEHIRNNTDDLEEHGVYLGVIITPGNSMTQILVDDREGFTVGQTDRTSIIPLNLKSGDESLLGKMGLHPSDLAMSFVYFDLVKELAPVSLKTISCRVFLLQDPANARDFVKVYVAQDYFFTLKAEFFKADSDPEKSEPYRTLEINAFRKQNGLYYVKTIDLYGPGWRTRVNFDQAEVNRFDPENPVKVFRQLPKK